jgi:hypothetical protein
METLATIKVSIVLPFNFRNGTERTHIGKIGRTVYEIWDQVGVNG